MNLKQFRDVLLSSNIPVYHCETSKKDGDYIVWNEVGVKRETADNVTDERIIRIALDYFTSDEFDTGMYDIEELLDKNDIAFSDVTIDYESDTGYTHYAWTCEVT